MRAIYLHQGWLATVHRFYVRIENIRRASLQRTMACIGETGSYVIP